MTEEEKLDAEKNRHEYLLMEMRLIGEDIKDQIIEKRIEPIETMIAEIVSWKYYILGAAAVACLFLTFVWENGYVHTHQDGVKVEAAARPH